jgi:ankyrin repeat protein
MLVCLLIIIIIFIFKATYVVNLHHEVKSGNLDVVRRGVNSGNVNDRDRQQQTLLHVACYENNTEMVRLLLETKADVDVQDRNGWTPLHCAASAGRYDVVLLLMEDDADLTALNRDGTSVMHYLVRRFVPETQEKSFVTVLKAMIDRDFDVNTQNKFGESPLHQACLRGNIPSIKILLKSNAKVDVVNKYVFRVCVCVCVCVYSAVFCCCWKSQCWFTSVFCLPFVAVVVDHYYLCSGCKPHLAV